MERKCSVALKNGSLLTARRYGVHLTSDDGGTLLVQDSAIRAETSSIVVKDSNFENFWRASVGFRHRRIYPFL